MSHKTALFVGRFQPFHKGHLSVVKYLAFHYEKVVIGIGSAEDNYLPKNPFTAGERYEMIHRALEEEELNLSKIAIIPVRNINNYALWVRHVELMLPKFDVVYTGSSIVKRLFKDDRKYKVEEVKKKIMTSATKVRRKILECEKWEDLLPPATKNYLLSIKGDKRIRKIN